MLTFIVKSFESFKISGIQSNVAHTKTIAVPGILKHFDSMVQYTTQYTAIASFYNQILSINSKSLYRDNSQRMRL